MYIIIAAALRQQALIINPQACAIDMTVLFGYENTYFVLIVEIMI